MYFVHSAEQCFLEHNTQVGIGVTCSVTCWVINMILVLFMFFQSDGTCNECAGRGNLWFWIVWRVWRGFFSLNICGDGSSFDAFTHANIRGHQLLEFFDSRDFITADGLRDSSAAISTFKAYVYFMLSAVLSARGYKFFRWYKAEITLSSQLYYSFTIAIARSKLLSVRYRFLMIVSGYHCTRIFRWNDFSLLQMGNCSYCSLNAFKKMVYNVVESRHVEKVAHFSRTS